MGMFLDNNLRYEGGGSTIGKRLEKPKTQKLILRWERQWVDN